MNGRVPHIVCRGDPILRKFPLDADVPLLRVRSLGIGGEVFIGAEVDEGRVVAERQWVWISALDPLPWIRKTRREIDDSIIPEWRRLAEPHVVVERGQMEASSIGRP